MKARIDFEPEVWDAGKSESYFYTGDWSVARALRLDYPHPSVYFRGSKPFAWQFLIPKRIVPLILKKAQSQLRLSEVELKESETRGVETKAVTPG